MLEDAVHKLCLRGKNYTFKYSSRVLNYPRLKYTLEVQPQKLYTRLPIVLSTRISRDYYYVVNVRTDGYSKISRSLYERDFKKYKVNSDKIRSLTQLLEVRAELLGRMMAEYLAVKKPVFSILTPYGVFRGLFEPSDELKGFLKFDRTGRIILGSSRLGEKILIHYDR